MAAGVDNPAPVAGSKKATVIAHRGASALRPEHTLAAYALAITDGADFIEPDLVSTKDGVLVARHENEIGSTTDVAAHPEFQARKTRKDIDGQRIEGWFTEDFTLQELKTLRARERLPGLRSQQYDGEFGIPTLAEIIDLVAESSSTMGRIIGLIPELKHGEYFRSLGLPVEDLLLDVLDAHASQREAYTREAPVVIQSFEVSSLVYLKERIGDRHRNVSLMQLLDASELQPADQRLLGTGLTYGDMMTPDGLRQIARYARSLGPSLRSVIPWDTRHVLGRPSCLVHDATVAGLQVFPWTFRPENRFLAEPFKSAAGPDARNAEGSINEIRAFLATGIAGFFTDDPALGRKAVDGFLRNPK